MPRESALLRTQKTERFLGGFSVCVFSSTVYALIFHHGKVTAMFLFQQPPSLSFSRSSLFTTLLPYLGNKEGLFQVSSEYRPTCKRYHVGGWGKGGMIYSSMYLPDVSLFHLEIFNCVSWIMTASALAMLCYLFRERIYLFFLLQPHLCSGHFN